MFFCCFVVLLFFCCFFVFCAPSPSPSLVVLFVLSLSLSLCHVPSRRFGLSGPSSGWNKAKGGAGMGLSPLYRLGRWAGFSFGYFPVLFNLYNLFFIFSVLGLYFKLFLCFPF